MCDVVFFVEKSDLSYSLNATNGNVFLCIG